MPFQLPLTRFATDHHSFVFGSKQVREIARPGANAHGRVDDMGQMSWQVDSLAETVNATPWLKERGITITRVGRDMPGSNWHTYFLDPEGHNNELFYGMEQIEEFAAASDCPPLTEEQIQRVNELFEANYGLENVGRIIHEVGTTRMGHDPQTSVLNANCQAHDVRNLFVAYGGPFVSNAHKNCTWTILALAMRTADYIARARNQGTI